MSISDQETAQYTPWFSSIPEQKFIKENKKTKQKAAKEKEKLIKEINKINNGYKLWRNFKPYMNNRIFNSKMTFSTQKEQSCKEIESIVSLNTNKIINTENNQNKCLSECSISSIMSLAQDHRDNKSKDESNADTCKEIAVFAQFINNVGDVYSNWKYSSDINKIINSKIDKINKASGIVESKGSVRNNKKLFVYSESKSNVSVIRI